MDKTTEPSFDETLYNAVYEGIERITAQGVAHDEAIRLSLEAMYSALQSQARPVADDLKDRSAEKLAELQNEREQLAQQIRKHWDEALDLYRIVCVCAEEVAANFNHDQVTKGGDPPPLFLALTRLTARACRIALEVHHLLMGGFPLGALARVRTMHEIAVTAMVLADLGTDEGDTTVAKRYLEHSHVLAYKDALQFQKDAKVLGHEQMGTDEIEEMKEERDRLVAQYGAPFLKPYGWAVGLPGLTNKLDPSMSDLEALASVSHLRSHYKWASHEVHADAKSLLLNEFDFGPQPILLTGSLDEGLADPGHLALIYLHQTVVSLVFCSNPSPTSILAAQSIQALIDDAGDAFLRGEDSASADRAD